MYTNHICGNKWAHVYMFVSHFFYSEKKKRITKDSVITKVETAGGLLCQRETFA